MKFRIDGMKMAEEVTLQLAGLDIDGDITQPCRSMAVWIAHLSKAEKVDISHFLSAIFIIAGDSIQIYWPTRTACQLYLQRCNLPDKPRTVLLEEAWNWGFRNVKFDPETETFSEIIHQQDIRPGWSEQLARLFSEVSQLAKSNGLTNPRLEHVIACLLDNPEYNERSALEESCLDVRLLREAIREKKWSIAMK